MTPLPSPLLVCIWNGDKATPHIGIALSNMLSKYCVISGTEMPMRKGIPPETNKQTISLEERSEIPRAEVCTLDAQGRAFGLDLEPLCLNSIIWL